MFLSGLVCVAGSVCVHVWVGVYLEHMLNFAAGWTGGSIVSKGYQIQLLSNTHVVYCTNRTSFTY